jgi:hypothetical protein
MGIVLRRETPILPHFNTTTVVGNHAATAAAHADEFS